MLCGYLGVRARARGWVRVEGLRLANGPKHVEAQKMHVGPRRISRALTWGERSLCHRRRQGPPPATFESGPDLFFNTVRACACECACVSFCACACVCLCELSVRECVCVCVCVCVCYLCGCGSVRLCVPVGVRPHELCLSGQLFALWRICTCGLRRLNLQELCSRWHAVAGTEQGKTAQPLWSSSARMVRWV